MSEQSGLLPLEYCRIERAAEQLSCKVEDIVHWGVIGAIELGILIPRSKPVKATIIVKKGLWGNREEWLKQTVSSASCWKNNGVSWLFDIEPSVGATSSHHGKEADSFDALACGVFAVFDGVLIDIEAGGKYSDDLWFYPADTWEDGYQTDFSCVCEERELTSKDLWITRKQLERLHHHLTHGVALPNIYNEPEHNKQAQERLSDELMPRYRLPTQEDLVLSAIRRRNLAPLELPMWEPGRPGIKASLKDELLSEKSEVFTEKSFKKTWERLMDDGRIAYLK